MREEYVSILERDPEVLHAEIQKWKDRYHLQLGAGKDKDKVIREQRKELRRLRRTDA